MYGVEFGPVEYGIGLEKVMLLYPKYIPILFTAELATTISSQVSLLKSPIATARKPSIYSIGF
jgi:hypothetical protein